MSKNSNERIRETGLYERNGLVLKQGKRYLFFGVLLLIMELALVFLILRSESFFDGEATFFLVKDTVLYLYIAVMLLSSLPIFYILVGISSFQHSTKSRNAAYTDGERRLVSMVPVKGGIYIGEIENICPECDAEVGLFTAKYCQKCGCELNSEEERPE